VGKGSGLGLAVVYGIMKELNGFIEIKSRAGKGTTVCCYFPVTDVVSTKSIEDTEKIPGGTETILFVDDEESLVKLGRKQLERMGYTVETITDPSEALARFKTDPEKFDLVITDMAMPKMTGDRLIKELVKIRDDIKTIICTGYSQKIDNEKASEIGASGYIVKPIDRKILAETLRNVINGTKG